LANPRLGCIISQHPVSFAFPFRFYNISSASRQGDQIGQSFAYWAIGYFGQFIRKLQKYP
jgi:hypothetical protein